MDGKKNRINDRYENRNENRNRNRNRSERVLRILLSNSVRIALLSDYKTVKVLKPTWTHKYT